MTDADFLRAFESATLPRAEWTHEAHVRMGYLTLRRLPLSEALAYARQRIRCYNEAQGNLTGYHETITVAFLTLIAARLTADDAGTWETFRAEHSNLIQNGIGVLLGHYSRERLFSAEARSAFVSPDMTPLPTL